MIWDTKIRGTRERTQKRRKQQPPPPCEKPADQNSHQRSGQIKMVVLVPADILRQLRFLAGLQKRVATLLHDFHGGVYFEHRGSTVPQKS
jgi:hypothetical protein